MEEITKVRGVITLRVKDAKGRQKALIVRSNTITDFYRTMLRDGVRLGAIPANSQATAIAFTNAPTPTVTNSTGQGAQNAAGYSTQFVYASPAISTPSGGIGTRLVATSTAGAASFVGQITGIAFCGALCNPNAGSTPLSATALYTPATPNPWLLAGYAYSTAGLPSLNSGDSVTVTWDLMIG